LLFGAPDSKAINENLNNPPPVSKHAVIEEANRGNKHENKKEEPKLVASSSKAVAVSESEAKKIVLEHAKLNENEVRLYRSELDRERGKVVYEIDFDSGRYEYEYVIDASNGNILHEHKEWDD
jgi:uncharacterized membrane protein YkoI